MAGPKPTASDLYPQDPLGAASGEWMSGKVSDISPLFTPERAVQFAQNPFAVGQDPEVLRAVVRNTPAQGLYESALGKYQEHMGTPGRMNVPDVQQGPVAQLAAYGQPANPFAGYTPEQLGKMITTGSSGSSSRTTQTTKGLASMPGYQQGLTSIGMQWGEAQRKIGEAQVEQAKQQALAFRGHATALRASQEKVAAQEKEMQAQIAAQEAKASALRADVAAAKVDPDHWWSTRTAGQRVSLGIAAALSGFVAGFRGQSGPNAVVALTQQLVDRDIKLQLTDIAKKGKEASEERGVVADLYRRLGDIRQAEVQGRIMLTEGLKTKLDQISATAAAPLARENARLSSLQLDLQILGLKQTAFQQSQDRVTGSKSSSSTSQRAPLAAVLAKMQAAQAAGNKPKEAGKVGGPPTQEIRQKLGTMNGLRRDLVHFVKKYKELGLPAGATGFWGGKGAAVQEMGNRILDRYVASVVPGGGSTEHLKLFKGLLGGKYATDSDLMTRIGNVMSEVDAVEQTTLEAEADAGINVRPFVERAQKYRALTGHLRGGH